MAISVRLLSDLDQQRRHLGTARAVRRLLPEPESWLDVATGDADFPETARRLFPYTSFDGTDPTPRVTHAQAAELVEQAYVGPLTHPHIARAVRSRYDVVTMLRTPASREELRAAVTALRPSGLLLLEAPGPHWAGVCSELESQGCVLVPPKHPLLDRLTKTRRLIARRAPAAPL
ncbi:methyltransferase domain-containing protein [Streptomyces sp. NPDC005799]|uniref:methyltransferase domain-containing protein n=1 Tax=Streptomyces sp. NPDC005799 TaxID=3154678 RepID=UPI0033FAEDDE